MWQELEDLQLNPVRTQEIENARAALIGGYALNTQAASSRISDYINCYLLGRPIPFAPEYRRILESIAPEDIRELAKKTFTRENAAMGLIRGTTEQTDAEKLVLA